MRAPRCTRRTSVSVASPEDSPSFPTREIGHLEILAGLYVGRWRRRSRRRSTRRARSRCQARSGASPAPVSFFTRTNGTVPAPSFVDDRSFQRTRARCFSQHARDRHSSRDSSPDTRSHPNETPAARARFRAPARGRARRHLHERPHDLDPHRLSDPSSTPPPRKLFSQNTTPNGYIYQSPLAHLAALVEDLRSDWRFRI